LEDIPENLMQKNSYREIEQKVFEKLLNNKKNTSRSSSRASQLKGGEKVRHNEFGDGIVVSVSGVIITVAFKKAGIKRLSAEFAKLKKI
jgi:hypothetical protein